MKALAKQSLAWHLIRYTVSHTKEQTVKANKYGVAIKTRKAKQRPVPMDLSGEQGTRLVLTTAKRVMATHAKVIKALANR